MGRDGLIYPFLLDIALQDSRWPRGPWQQWPSRHLPEARSPQDQRCAGKPAVFSSAWFGPNQHFSKLDTSRNKQQPSPREPVTLFECHLTPPLHTSLPPVPLNTVSMNGGLLLKLGLDVVGGRGVQSSSPGMLLLRSTSTQMWRAGAGTGAGHSCLQSPVSPTPSHSGNMFHTNLVSPVCPQLFP